MKFLKNLKINVPAFKLRFAHFFSSKTLKFFYFSKPFNILTIYYGRNKIDEFAQIESVQLKEKLDYYSIKTGRIPYLIYIISDDVLYFRIREDEEIDNSSDFIYGNYWKFLFPDREEISKFISSFIKETDGSYIFSFTERSKMSSICSEFPELEENLLITPIYSVMDSLNLYKLTGCGYSAEAVSSDFGVIIDLQKIKENDDSGSIISQDYSNIDAEVLLNNSDEYIRRGLEKKLENIGYFKKYLFYSKRIFRYYIYGIIFALILITGALILTGLNGGRLRYVEKLSQMKEEALRLEEVHKKINGKMINNFKTNFLVMISQSASAGLVFDKLQIKDNTDGVQAVITGETVSENSIKEFRDSLTDIYGAENIRSELSNLQSRGKKWEFQLKILFRL